MPAVQDHRIAKFEACHPRACHDMDCGGLTPLWSARHVAPFQSTDMSAHSKPSPTSNGTLTRRHRSLIFIGFEMNAPHNLFNTLQSFDLGNGKQGKFYSLPALEKAGIGNVARLPVSIRLVLESVLRNCDGKKVSEANVKELANWKPTETRTAEIPFVVARIVLQDFT